MGGGSPDHLARAAASLPVSFPWLVLRALLEYISRTSLFDDLNSVPRTTNSPLNSNNLGNPFWKPWSWASLTGKTGPTKHLKLLSGDPTLWRVRGRRVVMLARSLGKGPIPKPLKDRVKSLRGSETGCPKDNLLMCAKGWSFWPPDGLALQP